MFIRKNKTTLEWLVQSNVLVMSHGRFQSFHHHMMVILMSRMTGWRMGLQVSSYQSAQCVFLFFTLLSCILFMISIFLYRLLIVFALPPVAQTKLWSLHGWRELLQIFYRSGFTSGEFSPQLSDIAMAGQQVQCLLSAVLVDGAVRYNHWN